MPEMQSTRMWVAYRMPNMWIDPCLLTPFSKILSPLISYYTIWWCHTISFKWSSQSYKKLLWLSAKSSKSWQVLSPKAQFLFTCSLIRRILWTNLFTFLNLPYGCVDAGNMPAPCVCCPKCKQYFCLDCDIYIHESLHNCPGCESFRQSKSIDSELRMRWRTSEKL